MSEHDSKTVKELEDILLRAKYRDPAKYGTSEDEDIVIDAYNAISTVEKRSHNALIKYLYDFLEDPDEYLREIAVSAFGGFRADEVPEFKEKSFKIWNNINEDEHVRYIALGVWYGFYKNTQDKNALNILYQILTDKNYSISFRARAAGGIMEVSGLTQNGEGVALYFSRGNMKDPNEFNAAVDWDTITKIMQKHAPDALD